MARLIGAQLARALFTYFACFDLALMLDLRWRVGASGEDVCIGELVEFVRE